jgi:hypothetical protein
VRRRRSTSGFAFGLPLAAALLLAACEAEPDPSGLGEPIRLRGASFKEAELPGAPPSATPAPAGAPRVTFVETNSAILHAGQSGRVLGGRATPNAVAVALRFAGLGRGYWVLPVGDPDPTADNELGWQVPYELPYGTPPGPQRLLLVALDAAGNAGPQRAFDVCVASAVPDNLNACDPSIAPPAFVVSLAWDRPMDLDLQLVTPEGKRVDGARPTTALPAEGATGTRPGPNDGVLDFDAVAGCHHEGRRRESLVWQGAPRRGRYQVHVNVTEACAQQTANFHLTLHQAVAQPDGTQRLVEVARRSGRVLGASANGGGALGLLVTTFEF